MGLLGKGKLPPSHKAWDLLAGKLGFYQARARAGTGTRGTLDVRRWRWLSLLVRVHARVHAHVGQGLFCDGP